MDVGFKFQHASGARARVPVRYMVHDAQTAVEWYARHLGFNVQLNAPPAFASVQLRPVRLLLSGHSSSAGRPMPGGWNRIQQVVSDIVVEMERLRAAGASFRNEIIVGPGGYQVLAEDPLGNVV